MDNKTIIEFGFVSYEELWRSRRVLSAITPSSIFVILHKILSLIHELLILLAAK